MFAKLGSIAVRENIYIYVTFVNMHFEVKDSVVMWHLNQLNNKEFTCAMIG